MPSYTSTKHNNNDASDDITDTNSVSTAAMFSYPSSPLFEQPFTNRDFYAEHVPLRSRNSNNPMNASTAAASNNNPQSNRTASSENDAFFAPRNPYFTTPPTRRKRSSLFFSNNGGGVGETDRWVKQVMRLVLLSPLIVLVIWSVGAVCFASSRSNNMATSQQKQHALWLQQQQQQQKKLQRKSSKRGSIPQQRPPLATETAAPPRGNAKEFVQEGLLEVVELSGDLLGEAQPADISAPHVQVQPLLAQEAEQQQPLPQVQPLMASAEVEQSQARALPHPGHDHPQPVPVLFNPLGATVAQQQQQQQQYGVQALESKASQFVHSVENSVDQYWHPGGQPQHQQHHAHQHSKQHSNRHPNKKRLAGPLAASQHDNIIVQPQHVTMNYESNNNSDNEKTKQKKVVYYYYDPQAARMGSDGQWYLPQVVYDTDGRAWNTNSIGRGGTTQVLVQPPPPSSLSQPQEQPPLGQSNSNSNTVSSPKLGSSSSASSSSTNKSGSQRSSSSTSNTSTNSQSTKVNWDTTVSVVDEAPENNVPPVVPLPDPAKSLSFPSHDEIQQAVQRAESRYQENGSSVIVATVAVMALLVGAISARKLRGRASILNTCIENERYGQDQIDDTATETTNTAYSTFHWKGDLEKFDV